MLCMLLQWPAGASGQERTRLGGHPGEVTLYHDTA
jgi:hypothetical protein